MIDYFPKLPPLSDFEQGLISEKIEIDAKYKLPKNITYCKKCVISNQRPRIVFDGEGVCSACRYWERKKAVIDWREREKELEDLCNRYRRNDGSFDVLVPSSGGKDSVYVAWELKTKYGMHPLTMTWAPHVYTEIGIRNFQAHIHAGLDNVCYTPNGVVHRRMTRLSTIEIGDPFQPFIYGQTYLPLRVALNYGIDLVMDGENGESEYGGDTTTESKTGFTPKDAEEFWLSSFPLEHWKDRGFTDRDLQIYSAPNFDRLQKSKVERHFFSYYRDWRPQNHYYYCVENTNFAPNPNGRSEGTFSKYASLDDQIDPYHHYFSLLKFGIARATSDAAHEIREDLLARDEAVQLVRRYDSEMPSEKTTKVFLDYAGLTSGQLAEIIERWRNTRLWSGVGASSRLINQVSI
ncbi:MAG: N-acetyl sugar amidotransferase [Undibacterium sp.]|uniref:N-acetyl sugar amidotransferase n=1 Tax=Undibacterium sp. TaxID=1914977 RepID=UPI0027213F04|nr:N-acetyl sugar amidotransferase [Undibacterium sp.]MDO8652471.1 N-acetyl sugar amidotransferase [Undibacterium sp.]